MTTERSRLRRILVGALTYSAIIAVTLIVIDIICIALGLFPPRHNFGDADLGWRSAAATGKMAIGRCLEFSTGETITYDRNEDGVRTTWSKARLVADDSTLKIAVTGDSQTDLCARNENVHSGYLESALVAKGIPTTVLSYGAGKYSPLQAYLAFRTVLRPYRPDVLILNVYTGNDLYDILRVDDRPHFATADTGYRIADPVWFSLDDPKVHRRSRVLYAARTFGDRLGFRRLYLRVSELHRLGSQQGAGIGTVFAYMKDLWKAREPTVGYSDAFTSQMLNQQLFFHHFPGSRTESIRRIRALMAMIRAENPEITLVMSPLPSYELTGEQPVDSALIRTLARLPLTYQAGVEQERSLYEDLRALAAEQEWIFIDNLAALRSHHGSERLYNDFDYHLLPPASALIGRAQAEALIETLGVRRGKAHTQPSAKPAGKGASREPRAP